jgi:hypothetical protein
VRLRPSGDVDEVHSLGVEEFYQRPISARRSGSGAIQIRIAGGNEFDILHAPPGIQVKLRKESAAHNGAAKLHCPVTCLTKSKNAFLRGELMPQCTGIDWYPST